MRLRAWLRRQWRIFSTNPIIEDIRERGPVARVTFDADGAHYQRLSGHMLPDFDGAAERICDGAMLVDCPSCEAEKRRVR